MVLSDCTKNLIDVVNIAAKTPLAKYGSIDVRPARESNLALKNRIAFNALKSRYKNGCHKQLATTLAPYLHSPETPRYLFATSVR
jgi:hypothetical protein